MVETEDNTEIPRSLAASLCCCQGLLFFVFVFVIFGVKWLMCFSVGKECMEDREMVQLGVLFGSRLM